MLLYESFIPVSPSKTFQRVAKTEQIRRAVDVNEERECLVLLVAAQAAESLMDNLDIVALW